jgi:uncharacterized Ntn-hydrolase superfamily protein
MTFSLVARCPDTGMFGVAVASSSPAVAARCAHALAGIGAVSSQNVTDPALGPRALALLREGASAAEAVAILKRGAHAEFRQILIVDPDGNTAVHSGPRALGVFAEAREHNVASGGNMLAHDGVPRAVVDGFLAAPGALGDRLIAAMHAGLAAGGEAGPIHSIGMKLVREMSWPVADLRIDWTDGDPVAELAALWARYAPQLEDYVTRAKDPTAAPSFGVAGDERR